MKSLWTLLLVASLMVLAACGGGGSSSSSSQSNGALAGNWQFVMTGPTDNSFVGGLQGGFLLQNQGALNGSVRYSVSIPGAQLPCNSGSTAMTGTVSGQGVSLNASAGGQTYTLTGTLSADGSTIVGTYSTTAGAMVGGVQCGTAQTGLQWTAHSVPALTGAVQGNLHNTAGGLAQDQDLAVTGMLTQGQNIGASSATVSGTISFLDYPCLGSGSILNVTGNISGNSVLLQIFSDTGVAIGQIGGAPNSVSPAPVTFDKITSGDYVLHGTGGFQITNKACQSAGNICLAMGNANDCQQPISVSPSFISFPAQLLGSAPTSQVITITNSDPGGSTLTGLKLLWNPQAGYSTPFLGLSDFNGLPNYAEKDTCATTPGSAFSLAPGQSCTATISFSPQQSCTWLPSSGSGGVAPAQCPPDLTGNVPTPPGLAATLEVSGTKSVDGDTKFSVLANGVGLSAIQPSTPELDFGSVALSEQSAPQTLSFTNQGALPVQIFPAATKPCQNPKGAGLLKFPNPVHSGDVDGIRILQGVIQPTTLDSGASSILYLCDQDVTSGLANFQISSDSCTGRVLAAQESCSLNVTYVPQPATPVLTGLDYFLQLNTLQCTASSPTAYCEIDSGRMPVEVKANPQSPLRMTPGAGLDFGPQPKGTPSNPLTITLYNDPKDPNATPVSFRGNVVSGDYAETDTCGAGLAPGASCTLSIVFTPKSTGYDPGTMTITYVGSAISGPQLQTVYFRGKGQ